MTTTSKLWLLALVALGCGAFACGGSTSTTTGGSSSSSSGSGGSSGGLTPQAACADVSKARCTHEDMCTNNLGTKVTFGDEATCEARGTDACVGALAAADTSQTPTTIEACATATPMESCSDLLANTPIAACVPKPGARVDGKACAYNAQCASTFCKYSSGSMCGACAELPKAGDACQATVDCGRDLLCDKALGQCVPPLAKDAACDKTHPCGPSLTCVGATMMAMGKCQASGTMAGADCDPKHATAAGCDGNVGLFCSPASKKCESVMLSTAGMPCGVVNTSSYAICTGGAACILDQGKTTGMCVAPAADGAACDTAKGPPCLNPARCVSATMGSTAGTCVLAKNEMCN